MQKISKAGVDASPKAAAIIDLMEKFSTFFGLKLCIGATEQTLTTLQYKDISALSSVTASIRFQRNEEAFHLFYESVILEAKRILFKESAKMINYDGGSSHIFENPEQLYRQQY